MLRIEDWAVFNHGVSALVLIEVQYAEGGGDTYLITLGLLFGKAADALKEESPNALVARLTSMEGDGVLHEAIFNDAACEALLALIAGGSRFPHERARSAECPAARWLDCRATSARLLCRAVAPRNRATLRSFSATS